MEVGTPSAASAEGSPRLSFSHDLPQGDTFESSTAGDHRLDLSPLTSDFDFSLGADVCSHDSSLADDIFSNGKLLPLPIKHLPPPPSRSTSAYPPRPAPSAPTSAPFSLIKRGSLREVMAISDGDGDGIFPQPSQQKPFWRFRRSTSLSFGRGGRLCPFPLLRSKSSGLSSPIQIRPNPSQSDDASHIIKSSSPFADLLKRSPSESKTRIYYCSANSRRTHGNAVRISPVLNMPMPSSTGFFSFLICNRGHKNMVKSSPVICPP